MQNETRPSHPWLPPEDLSGDVKAITNPSVGEGVTFHCSRGHHISKVFLGESPQLCDACYELVAAGKEVYSCLRCSYFLCLQCSGARLKRETAEGVDRMAASLEHVSAIGAFSCQAGHPLRLPATPPDGTVACNKCGGPVQPGHLLECATCDTGTSQRWRCCVACLLTEAEISARSGAGARPPDAFVSRFQGIRCQRHKTRCGVTVMKGNALFCDVGCVICHRGRAGSEQFVEGDVAVLCPARRCEITLCADCANLVVRQRLIAAKANPTMSDGAVCDLAVEVGRYPFLCSLCDGYFVPSGDGPEEEPLVWLADHRTCFSMCLSCARADRLLEVHPDFRKDPAQLNSFRRYRTWKSFARRQERLYEQDITATSILDSTLDLSREAFLELELILHRKPHLPFPIRYEVEVALARKELLRDFDPFLRKLIQMARWPLHTGLRLLCLAREERKQNDHTAMIWSNQISCLETVTVQMVEQLDEPGFLRQLILNPRPARHAPPRPVISLALEADHVQFLAHRAVQAVVAQKWQSPARTDEGFSTATWVMTRALLVVTALLIRAWNFLTRGRLGRRLETVQDRQQHPMVFLFTQTLDKTQFHTLEFFSLSPRTAFGMSAISYVTFVAFVSFTASRSSAPNFEAWDWINSVWVVSLALVEAIQLLKRGTRDYFQSIWNYFDALHLSVYVGTLSVKAVAAFVRSPGGQTRLLEAYDITYAFAVFLSWTRGLYLLLTFRRVGPMLVSFGKMLQGVLVFLFIALMVILAFAFSIHHLFNNAGQEYDQTAASPDMPSNPGGLFRFMMLVHILKTLSFGVQNTPSALVPEELTAGRVVITTLLILGFMIVTTIVLVNLLIAVVSRIHSGIMERAEEEFRAHFASVVEEFSSTSPLPPPLNLLTIVVLPSVMLFLRVLRLIPGSCCGCCCSCTCCFRDVSDWSTPKPGRFVDSAHRHVNIFFAVKRLAKARQAEAAIHHKLHGWLQARLARARDDEEDELRKRIKKLTDELSELALGATGLIGTLVRPPSSAEIDRRRCIRTIPESNAVVLEGSPPKVFTFDYVAGCETSQEEIFEVVGKPVTEACFGGYNATVFAYGQTGSGKTHTMLGATDDGGSEVYELRGIAPRALQFLFGLIASDQREEGERPTFLCRCSMVEIYNEAVSDLLEPSSQNLHVREDWQRGAFIEGVQEETVSGWEQAYALLKKGSRQRTTGETLMNAKSSRSHCVFTVDVQSKKTEASGLLSLRHSRLHLVDLAGSERQKLTAAAGQRLKEAGQINKSLSTLANVIRSLVDIAAGKERHVHFRDSKLTFLLRDSLGGNSKTSVVATISPSDESYGETLSTLLFAQRAKLIKNKAVINEQVAGNTQQLQAELMRVKEELELFKAQAQAQIPTQAPAGDMSQAFPIASPLSASQRLSAISFRDWEEEKTRMEATLLRMQERSYETSQDREALRLKADLLQDSLIKTEQIILQLRFALKLREAAMEKMMTSPNEAQAIEIQRLKDENKQLVGNNVDASAFLRLKVEVFKLQEALRKEVISADAKLLLEKLDEANSTIADLEKQCREFSKNFAPKISFSIPGSASPSDSSLDAPAAKQPAPAPPTATAPATPMRVKPFEDLARQEIVFGSPSRRAQPANAQALAELQAEVLKLKQKNGELSLEAEQLHEKLQKAEQDLSMARETAERFEAEASMLRDVAETSRLKADVSSKSQQSAEVAIIELTQQLEESQQEAAALKQRLETSGSATVKESEQLRMERDQALRAKAESDSRLAEIEKELALLRQQKANAEAERRTAIERETAIGRSWSEERSEHKKLAEVRERELASKNEDLRSLTAHQTALEAQIHEMQEELIKIRSEAVNAQEPAVEGILAEIEAMEQQ